MFIESIKQILAPARERGSSGGPARERESSGGPPSSSQVDAIHLAACALLLQVAYADGEFSADEKEHLEAVLSRHFDLTPDDGRRLLELAEAERAGAIDQFEFTSVVKRGYDIGQKMVLAEVMWGLVLADGEVARHEHYLTRKIANLLDLKPGYLSKAKKAAEGT